MKQHAVSIASPSIDKRRRRRSIDSPPKRIGNVTSKHDRASDLKKVMTFSFSYTILLGGMCTRCLIKNSMVTKIFGKVIGQILTPIINAKDLDWWFEDIFNEFMKLFEYRTSFRFVFHEIDPIASSVIIDKSYKPTSTRKVWTTCRTPNITMNQVKWLWWFICLYRIMFARLFSIDTMFIAKGLNVFYQ